MSRPVPPTKRSTPRLSEIARHLVIPAGIIATGWPRIERRLGSMGVEFDWWQADACRVVLGKRDNGKYAATVGGVLWSIPRQVGKTWTLSQLLVAMCLEFPGLRIVWTSHHLRTTTNTFRAVQSVVRRKKVFGHLAPNGIRVANGEQEIRFANGSIIMFGAREQGFGRGMDAIDIVVFDEAQILGLKALEDMVPSTNAARHPHGALLFFIGTPPRPVDDGEAFTSKREKAITGKSGDAMYLEFGADPDADSDDRGQWVKANPSFPARTPLESMLRMRENLGSDESWRREALGIWDDFTTARVIDEQSWADCLDEESVAVERLVLAVDVAPDRALASIGLAGRTTDGRTHLELVETRQGTGWIPTFITDIASRNPISAVVVDGISPAASLADDLKRERLRVQVTGSAQMGQACGRIFDLVMAQQVAHIGQPQLATALAGARKRNIGTEGAWGWSRKNSHVDITPLVAVTLAAWGVGATKVRTRSGRSRKVVVYS